MLHQSYGTALHLKVSQHSMGFLGTTLLVPDFEGSGTIMIGQFRVCSGILAVLMVINKQGVGAASPADVNLNREPVGLDCPPLAVLLSCTS